MRPFHMTSRRRFDCRLTVLVTVWLLRAPAFRSYLTQLSWCVAFALPWMLCQRVVAGSFESVADLLAANCLECHDHHDAAGSLDLSRASGIQAGGESGAAYVTGSADESLIVQRLRLGEMPPPRQGRSQRLPDAAIEQIAEWIEAGAPWEPGRQLDRFERSSGVRAGRDWWSLQPLRRPQIPSSQTAWPVSNPIDAFLQKNLVAQGLSPSPPADRRDWLKRLYIDITGLAPTLGDYERFLQDRRPDAAAREVDMVLASPQFGERFARRWLDLVRYADTSGYERDQEKRFSWKYRDWVVAALNADQPYDRFVVEQLAGDQVPHPNEQTVIATGFLRLGTWNDEPNDPAEYQYERLEDLVHTTSTAFLGLTIKCARCHDHKYDPVRQTDYYQVAAAFWPGPVPARASELLGGPSAAELGYDEVLGWTDCRPDVEPLRLLIKGDPQRPGPEVPYAAISSIPWFNVLQDPNPRDSDTSRRYRLRLAEWIAHPQNPLTARVVVNRIWQAYFGRGLVSSVNNFGFLGERPSHPELLDWLACELIESGWQLKRIHRLILVSASYGQNTEHPQHEAFSQRDAENRWLWHANRRRLDAEGLRDAILNCGGQLDLQLGGRGFLPEISAEALEGLSRKQAAWQPSPVREQYRRSLYLYSQRSLLVPFMTTFDFVDTTTPCGQRDVTTVAPQALAMLNGEFIHLQSKRLAEQVLREAGSATRQAQVVAAWRIILARSPSDNELSQAAQYLQDQATHFQTQRADGHNSSVGGAPIDGRGPTTDQLALVSLCQVLMNTNEFIYID